MTRPMAPFDEDVSAVPVTPRRGLDSGWWLVIGAVLVPASLAAAAVVCAVAFGIEVGRRMVAR